MDFCDTLAAILKAAKAGQHKNRFQYGELYSLNYYKVVQEKGRSYYEVYTLLRSESAPEDYSEIDFVWVKIGDEQGFEALKPKKPTGKPPKLTKEQMAEIRTVLEEDEPKKYGHNVWDGSSLSVYIEETYAVKLCVRQCQRLFHSLGFSLVRPQTFPSKGERNEAERTEYKKAQKTLG